MEKRRGQISIEYLIVISFVTFVVLSVLGLAFFYSSQIRDTIKTNQMQNFCNKIISSAESTFYSGEPSRNTVTGHLPEGITNISIIKNSIFVEMVTSSGTNKIAFPSNVPINGTIPKSAGYKKILLEAKLDKVQISG
jgi:uncharacterized protein (UPF0333 family)